MGSHERCDCRGDAIYMEYGFHHGGLYEVLSRDSGGLDLNVSRQSVSRFEIGSIRVVCGGPWRVVEGYWDRQEP